MNSLHDIPGVQTKEVVIPKLADKTVGEWVVFKAPFKCVITKVELLAGAAWSGVNDADNYEQFILYDRGTDGSGSTALGTIVGSVNGTIISQGSNKAVYEPATALATAVDEVFTVKLGTVGAGSTAPAAMTVITSFKGA